MQPQTNKIYRLKGQVRAWLPKSDEITASTNVGAVRPDFRSGHEHLQQGFDMGQMYDNSFQELYLPENTRVKLVSYRPLEYYRFELLDGDHKGYQVDVSVIEIAPDTLIPEEDSANAQPEWKKVSDELDTDTGKQPASTT